MHQRRSMVRPKTVRPKWRAITIAAVAALVASMAAATAQAAPEPMPEVIPSLDGWEGVASGSYQVGSHPTIRIAEGSGLDSTAQILDAELSTLVDSVDVAAGAPAAGDISLQLDESRDDLGAQGYELTVGESITIEAAEPAGVFYGTRTVLQMLKQQSTLPAGSAVDVPEYEERGVTLCACVIHISPDFIDQLIEEMSYLKMNTLILELKLKVEGYPQTNTWSYYTKAQVADLVEKAGRYGIEVTPLINTPGHMGVWLENRQDLQLLNKKTGQRDPNRMDITRQESYEYYTDLIDEYSEVFTSDEWHMGVDEYMLGSGYGNYPQMLEFAQEKFGPEATEDDLVAWYVNRVNDYLRSKGKTMRIWNDGVITDNKVVDFDTTIHIDFWLQAASRVRAKEFVEWGHSITNVSNALYQVRGSYGVDARKQYTSKFSPARFSDGSVIKGAENVRGARMSLWPDGGTPREAENTVQKRMFEGLRLTAQMTWSNSHPWPTYDEFKSAMDALGRPPLWEIDPDAPVPPGSLTIELADGSGGLATGDDGSVTMSDTPEVFTLASTSDGYYTIKDSTGRCLDIARDGAIRLNVPVAIGADIEVNPCQNTTIHRWDLRPTNGGYQIVNAASQQHLTLSSGLDDVPVNAQGPKDIADGRVVQTPPDWAAAVWTLSGVRVDAVDRVSAQPREQVTVSVDVRNVSAGATGALTLKVATATGWAAVPRITIPALEPGGSVTRDFTLRNLRAKEAGTVELELWDGDTLLDTESIAVGST